MTWRCHLTPAVQVRPGVYLAEPDRWEETPAQAATADRHYWNDRHDHRDEE